MIEEVVKYICDEYFRKTNKNIDELKLQKLIYFSQKEVIALTGKPLFNDKIYAWRYGPVCKKVRKVFKDGSYNFYDININHQLKYIISNVIEKYKKYSSWNLSVLSHEEPAWKKARYKNYNLIRIEDIYEDVLKFRVYDSNWDMYFDEFEDLV